MMKPLLTVLSVWLLGVAVAEAVTFAFHLDVIGAFISGLVFGYAGLLGGLALAGRLWH